MATEVPLQCQHCGKPLGPGNARFVVNLTIYADLELELPESAEDGETLERRIEAILEQVQAMDESELEAEVHEKIHLVLCKRCRDVLRAWAVRGVIDANEGRGGLVH